jgi:hypothetical protein
LKSLEKNPDNSSETDKIHDVLNNLSGVIGNRRIRLPKPHGDSSGKAEINSNYCVKPRNNFNQAGAV